GDVVFAPSKFVTVLRFLRSERYMNLSQPRLPSGPVSGLRLAVIIEGGLALVAICAAWLFGVLLREWFPTTYLELGHGIVRGVVATLPMLAAFWWLVHADWPGLRQLREQVVMFVDEMFRDATPAQLAFVALLAGVGEELLFRGALQAIVTRWAGP